MINTDTVFAFEDEIVREREDIRFFIIALARVGCTAVIVGDAVEEMESFAITNARDADCVYDVEFSTKPTGRALTTVTFPALDTLTQ